MGIVHRWSRSLLMRVVMHVGTSYQAANWTRVGRVQGRGRQDRKRLHGETVKGIYIYPLLRDFRDRMGFSVHSGLGPLPLEVVLKSEGGLAGVRRGTFGRLVFGQAIGEECCFTI